MMIVTFWRRLGKALRQGEGNGNCLHVPLQGTHSRAIPPFPEVRVEQGYVVEAARPGCRADVIAAPTFPADSILPTPSATGESGEDDSASCVLQFLTSVSHGAHPPATMSLRDSPSQNVSTLRLLVIFHTWATCSCSISKLCHRRGQIGVWRSTWS